MNPGTSPGILNIKGNFTNTNVINVEIGGTGGAGVNPNGHDQLLISGTANLGGALNVTLTNGFTPALGNSFLILDAGNITTLFANLNLPNVSPNRWSVAYDNAAGTLALSVVAPTAALVSVSGRVLSPLGRALPRSQIFVTNSDGEKHRVISNSSGYYRINNLTAGETYVFRVSSTQYLFMPRLITLSENVIGFDLIAEP